MRNFIIILGICIIAGVLGSVLYLYGPSEFHISSFGTTPPGSLSFTILEQGNNAVQVSTRTNYRIQNQDQLAALWTLVYGSQGPYAPTIDFTHNEVLAVFDGSHSTGGYGVSVAKVTDTPTNRMITIARRVPGASCAVTQGQTSPFEIIELSLTKLPLAHEEQVATTTCP